MRLDPQRHAVELLRKSMRLDLGGIAKGLCHGRGPRGVAPRGIPAAMIHGGGDMALGDPPPGKPGWRVGIAPWMSTPPPASTSGFPAVRSRLPATLGSSWRSAASVTRISSIRIPALGWSITAWSRSSATTAAHRRADQGRAGRGTGKGSATGRSHARHGRLHPSVAARQNRNVPVVAMETTAAGGGRRPMILAGRALGRLPLEAMSARPGEPGAGRELRPRLFSGSPWSIIVADSVVERNSFRC